MHEFSTARRLMDEETWVDALYRAHAPALFAFLRRQVATRADAEDLLLEVFTAALEQSSLANLDDARREAWLWRVARNKAVDHHRRAARRPTQDLEQLDDDHITSDEEDSPERDLLRRDEHRRLHAHLDRLSPLQRDILRLRFAEGLHSGEIAHVLGQKDSSVRVLLMRTLRSLRAIYARQDRQEGGDSR